MYSRFRRCFHRSRIVLPCFATLRRRNLRPSYLFHSIANQHHTSTLTYLPSPCVTKISLSHLVSYPFSHLGTAARMASYSLKRPRPSWDLDLKPYIHRMKNLPSMKCIKRVISMKLEAVHESSPGTEHLSPPRSQGLPLKYAFPFCKQSASNLDFSPYVWSFLAFLLASALLKISLLCFHYLFSVLLLLRRQRMDNQKASETSTSGLGLGSPPVNPHAFKTDFDIRGRPHAHYHTHPRSVQTLSSLVVEIERFRRSETVSRGNDIHI